MTECHVLQQRSPAPTTIVNWRYVQWLAFNSILLREQPSTTIPPKDTLELEAPMTYNINIHSSVFPLKVKSKGDVFFTLDRGESPPSPLPSLLMCLQAACIHFPLSTGDTPTACWFSLAFGEGVLTVGCLSEPHLSANRNVTASRKDGYHYRRNPAMLLQFARWILLDFPCVQWTH